MEAGESKNCKAKKGFSENEGFPFGVVFLGILVYQGLHLNPKPYTLNPNGNCPAHRKLGGDLKSSV